MLVFGVKYRLGLINQDFRQHLHGFIGKLIKDYGHGSIPIKIGGTKDHVHILIGLSTKISVSELACIIKSLSTKWVNDNKLVVGKFAWQTGYAAFSYSSSAKEDVIRYIENQEEHHKQYTFREELERLLKLYNVNIDSIDLPDELQ